MMSNALDAGIAAFAQAVNVIDDSVVRVLVVDDDPVVTRIAQRALELAGYHVVTAPDGAEAAALLGEGEFDLVVSDVDMPRLDGIGLVRTVRSIDSETPVILVSGNARVEIAIAALELGVTRFLTKPLHPSQLVAAVGSAIGMLRVNRLRRRIADAAAEQARAQAEDQRCFESALDRLHMVFQPVVHWPSRSILGYEALARTAEPAVPHPGALFALTERLREVPRLGRAIRGACARALPAAPQDSLLFVNLHAAELLDPELIDPQSPLTRVANRVVLEIAERASIENLKEAVRRIAELRALGFRIAIDDIGAGYAGLNSFAMLEPEIVKLDMTMVRDVDKSPIKQRLIAWFIALCKPMKVSVIAEGVETHAELHALAELGCELFQGFLFAKPEREFRPTL